MGLVVMAPRDEAVPAVLAVDAMPDLATFTYAIQFFPRWTYEPVDPDDGGFDFGHDQGDVVDGYRRQDNITDDALAEYRTAYSHLDTLDEHETKNAIFYYVYGLLHSPTYRTEFSADLKKMLP
ncbi:MAG TPA: type ISP restriction/modification enzyme, partial [Blastocatellia bacterium]|nr:type ISP restriction/modification enzyme [Blastocatellia bacterium]